jgi:alpha-D-xyloside xylohydrolase
MKCQILILGLMAAATCGKTFGQTPPAPAPVEILPGVWRFTFGTPEKITPVSTRHYPPATNGLAALAAVAPCPVTVTATFSPRGSVVSVPLAEEEMIYGLGLQLQSFQQRGLKKRLRVNADPAMDTGDSHAPVPFYVTTRGYGVLIDTARYPVFYLGNKKHPPQPANDLKAGNRPDNWNGLSPDERRGLGAASDVLVEIPEAAGVDVYVFAGPSLRQAVQRYDLFSGGGPLPPRWGLGFWYRVQSDYTQEDVLKLAAEFRERRIPCDVLGLEPHWQSHSYCSSYLWSQRFPDSAGMMASLAGQHFRLNLWEQAFVDPSSPLYASLLAHCGDYEVWGGLVPDFLQAETRRIFSDYHEKTFVAQGAAGFKADECDNSDFTGGWSFPEMSRFPSGADGEQMHSLFGLRYQDALQGAFEKRRQRTYGLVRSSGALAAPYPYVLYSDLYDHRQFVRGVAQTGFSGLLWAPEVREAANPEELLRRLESAAFSPLAMINAWYLRSPPWKQVNRAANNQGQFAEGWENVEALCREVLELRMKFITYLHAAFVRYHREGLPPFRALIMDFPDDPQTRTIDDEYMMGDSLLVAPVIVEGAAGRGGRRAEPAGAVAGSAEAMRPVYLPAGVWHDFWKGERRQGGQRINVRVPVGRIPLFVKTGTVLPLAQATLDTADPASRKLTVWVYGDGERAATLFEDDGSWAPALDSVQLNWDNAAKSGRVLRSAPSLTNAYEILSWKQVE